MDYQKELEFAKSMAFEAGEVMKKYYRADQGVELKDDNTPVTLADKEINDMLITRVKNEFPDYGVLGEEANWNENREKLWVCDPIDGTVAYIMHIPTFMFSIALVVNGMPKIAVTYNPLTDDLYTAIENKGAFRGNEKISVSKKTWGIGVKLAGSSGGNTEPTEKHKVFLKQQGINVSGFHGTVFKGCLVAEGSIEGRIFIYKNAHDLAAIKLIIEEAGGKVTDLDGNEQRYDQPINGAIMSNGLIHDDLLKLVKEV